MICKSSIIAPLLMLALSAVGSAQVSPEEHASHHPGAASSGTSQVAQPGAGPMSGMGEMMKMMGGTPPQSQLYPSLMAIPEFTPERRAQVNAQAAEQMKVGLALVSEGLSRLEAAVTGNDAAAMQSATATMREGLAQFDSGISAQRALVEGKLPRDVALQWFKSQMGLTPTPAIAATGAALSWFHMAVMAILILFAIVMIWMYFFKMRRAALLLQGVTGNPSLPPPAEPRAADAAGPSAVGAGVTDTFTPRPTKWAGRLRVASIFEESPDTKSFRLMNPIGGVMPFTYLPGQFLTVTVIIDGKPVKRGYTIASSPTQHDYAEITIKHEDGGAVSGFLHAQVKVGDLLECSGPSGSFIFTGRECKCILLIGGGVGITPLMSVIRYLTDRSWPGDIYLLYGIHSPQDFVFREELEHLQRRHSNLRVIATVSHPEGTDWKGPTGRISRELIAKSVPDLASRYVHLCGPVSLMESVKSALLELGVPAPRIKTEAFGLALGKPEATKPAAVPPMTAEEKQAQLQLPTVNFSISDRAAPLPPEKTVLDIADEVGVEIDNSCRVGTCGTCRVKLLSGQVTMAIEDGLEPGDKEKGIILACQAKSKGNVVVEA